MTNKRLYCISIGRIVPNFSKQFFFGVNSGGKSVKRILIVGKNSYIGLSLKHYLKDKVNDYYLEELDTFGFDSASHNFKGFDTVVCVTGIAHIKETKANAQLYYSVNRDLCVQIAKKCKLEGVGHFVFLSSMSVYGKDCGIITPNTKPVPKNNYGKSKLQAEELLTSLCDKNFKITIIRPPMVYGKNCKGNFQTVIKLVDKLPIFPKVNNMRSMIHIDNLCNFIKICIDESKEGIFCPQNEEYVNTSTMAGIIATKKTKKLLLSRILGLAVVIMRPFSSLLKKAFGNLIYKDMETDNFSYCIIDQITSFNSSV